MLARRLTTILPDLTLAEAQVSMGVLLQELLVI
jgi:hypothetical protein